MMSLSLLDPLGSLCSLLATYYFTQARVRAFPLTLVAIVVNSILYYQKGIYAHLGLEVIYLISSFYGWITWSALRLKKDTLSRPTSVQVRPIPLIWALLFTLFALALIPLLAYVLKRWMDSSIPYWDATTTVLALLAQWMLCKKWIECWGVWFVRDFLVVILHWVKNIPFHSATHFIYLIMAIMGYLKWRKIMAAQSIVVNIHSSKAL